ncbi:MULTISPECIES: IclR family transcriptional regulator [unclassified Microbacterium]|uniref:IclR family transcriptional regulator n=1 Tax=unclassified Microbacterium TaxID=2609290 RepID=UPI00097EE476|nr:IclR family transcriptional regulator [Microbacterium sp. JB110]RCS63031.1 IclR family transcriptional regulator [Microbacterium sp. JB110]SJM60577.1 Transcriptional regulator, IclR family [Frigoribacterium sp. JB110]
MVIAERAAPPKAALPRSVDRALSIIGTFRQGRARQTLSEISRNAELPLATTYRMVNSLAEWGALERDDRGRYHVGLRLWEVGSLAPRSMAMQRIARPFMHDLYEITHYSIHLAICEGNETVFVERFQSPSQVLTRPRVGGRHDMHTTAVGRVLLAYAPLDERDRMLHEQLPPTVDAHAFKRELAEVRIRGYAISGRDLNTEYMAVAAPVTVPGGQVVAALSLIMRYEDADERNAAHLVRVAAGGISRALSAKR